MTRKKRGKYIQFCYSSDKTYGKNSLILDVCLIWFAQSKTLAI